MKIQKMLFGILILSSLALVGCPDSGGGNTVTPPKDTGVTEHPPVDPGMQTQRTGPASAPATATKEAGGELVD